MNDYKFSVLICVYGGDNALHFDQAMKSIFDQTLQSEEVVLVIDGPIGAELTNIVDKYAKLHSQLKTIQLETNQGHGNARRVGIENCTYEFIAIMDADDISVPDRFEKQVKIFKNNSQISIVGGQIYEFVDNTNNIVGIRNVPEKDADIKEYMKKRCPMNQVTVMFRKEHILSVGGYIDWYCEEDYYLWIRMAVAEMQFYNLSANLVFVRVGKEMYQRRGGTKYFKSEAKLQYYMLTKKLISPLRYLINVTERLIIQVLMPNKLRSWIFKKFARKQG